jgi:hypothetical protein
VCCSDATASSFVTKVRGEVFAHCYKVAVKRHSSMRNVMLCLPGRIFCEQMTAWSRKLWTPPRA